MLVFCEFSIFTKELFYGKRERDMNISLKSPQLHHLLRVSFRGTVVWFHVSNIT